MILENFEAPSYRGDYGIFPLPLHDDVPIIGFLFRTAASIVYGVGSLIGVELSRDRAQSPYTFEDGGGAVHSP
jgi:hypothetical protein